MRDRRRDRASNRSPASWAARRRGCSETTTDVLIESALWDPLNIAQTGRKLGINSDARYRFERGVDPAFMLPGLELATQHGARPVRRRAVGDHGRRQARRRPSASSISRSSELQAAGRPRDRRSPRSSACSAHLGFFVAGAGTTRQGRGAVLAARRATARPISSRRSCASSASTASPSTPFDRGDAPRKPVLTADPGAHPQGQARARRARHGRGGDLVVHLEAAGRAVRRRHSPSLRSPIRSRPTSPTCGRA